jgi:restriction endonuclease Mrr
MAWGLKAVRHRRSDALSRVGWDGLERLLAEHYRREGYRVEHVGTGGNGRRFDGGIDLKLRRDDAYVLVQSKHWNAYQVTHNAVHELLGLMVNEGATGAILVTSGEFTRAAIEAATRHGHVQLVDGDDLRAMLGEVSEPEGRARVGDWMSAM